MYASNSKGGIFVFGCYRLDVPERILLADGKPVALTPKVFDLLVLFVENPGKLLEKDWLLSSLWPGTFVEEANLSVNVSALRRAMEGAAGVHFIETVPKRGYRFTAGVQEVTPERPQPKQQEQPQRPWLWWAIAAVAFCLILLAVYLFALRPTPPVDNLVQVRSIAVLPFRPLVANGEVNRDDQYLGPGMSDALIRKLSSIRQITVRGTSAVQKYQGVNFDPRAAGRELMVQAVLDGTIQHVANAIRVSVQLLRTRDGTPIWADHFDDYATNIFQLQDSISEKIAAALSLKLTASEQRRMVKDQTTNTEAYQAYLRGRYCESQRTPDALDQACIALYERAVEKDPEFALAYTGIADVSMDLAGIQGSAEYTAKARIAAHKAIALDSTLTEAHLALGNVMFRGDWDWLGAEREFDRALELDPHSARAHWYMSLLAMAMAHTDRGLSEMIQAQLFDPASRIAHDDLGWAYYLVRRYPEAIKESKIALAMDPQSISAHHQLGKNYLHAGRYAEAKTEFLTTLKLDVTSRGLADLGQLYGLTGKGAQARECLHQLDRNNRKARTYESEYMRAMLLADLGEADAAFDSLGAAVDRKLSRAIWMRVDPDMDALRRDPRFELLLRRVHLLN